MDSLETDARLRHFGWHQSFAVRASARYSRSRSLRCTRDLGRLRSSTRTSPRRSSGKTLQTSCLEWVNGLRKSAQFLEFRQRAPITLLKRRRTDSNSARLETETCASRHRTIGDPASDPPLGDF